MQIEDFDGARIELKKQNEETHADSLADKIRNAAVGTGAISLTAFYKKKTKLGYISSNEKKLHNLYSYQLFSP